MPLNRPSLLAVGRALSLGLLSLTTARGTPSPADNPRGDAAPPSLEAKHAGLPPGEAAKAMRLPEGFSAKLFAGEPDVQQPIAGAFDDRGRLWLAEAYTETNHAPDSQGKDRILVFEDTDGDGKFDKRTAVMEGLNRLSGLEVGFGGVWVGAGSNLVYVSIKEGEDKPDGPARILLDGWAGDDARGTLSSFTWGPDGWLYGCQAAAAQSSVGKPGTPESQRTKFTAGVWRYHPTKKVFEVFAAGTGNLAGLDFDEHGQCFSLAQATSHLYHVIQGAHYPRPSGPELNPYVYGTLQPIANRLEDRGDPQDTNGVKNSGEVGDSPAYAVLMVYPGGSWPAKYRGQIFASHLHDNRLAVQMLERKGSGFVAQPGPDFIHLNDSRSQVVDLLADPDGSVYLIDRCARAPEANPAGRIFKVVAGDRNTTVDDPQMKLDRELADLLVAKNEWYARHVQRVLQERGVGRDVQAGLLKILRRNPDDARKLRALWALHVTGGLTEKEALSELKNRSEHIRAWTIQLLCENRNPPAAALAQFALLARGDPSPVVRLYLASALQRLAVNQRVDVLAGLLAHAEDANDPNLPLMYWYATEAVVGADSKAAATLMDNAKIQRVRDYIARRLAAGAKPG